ncbi:glutamate ABC transporter substrate-binding protein [Kitasatospora sp. RB6PN24]|uniref:glutamate ABC transporter substrate-binding protein n=1 Tax=Kitasatospora humi TaxID=2893891 RepID=UPI001E3A6A3F|nr:glutamate ABC transporter substrate-binding protein [Kitasatospora humi]MCC9306338.1 glutamate ABC transporter substrate-binding protein [Kitasatospora humi]
MKGTGRMRTRIALLAAVLATPLTLTGAAAAPGSGPRAAAAGSATAVADRNCDPTKSIRPSTNENGPAVSAIKARGVLVAGVDQDSYDWGFRNPVTGQLQGFDIDLVHAIAKALLGDPDKVQFKTVPTAKRMDAIKSGSVDLIARTMTITCDRLDDLAFSTEYFQAGQQVVVPKAAHARTIDDAVRGKRVCVADSSTAQDYLGKHPLGQSAEVVVENQLDCLVRMQLGQADATVTDNALAVGQAAQDPTVQVIGPSLTNEPYGVAMAKNAPDLVARVNQVLEDYRRSGWQDSYDHWLKPGLGPMSPPAANYLP